MPRFFFFGSASCPVRTALNTHRFRCRLASSAACNAGGACQELGHTLPHITPFTGGPANASASTGILDVPVRTPLNHVHPNLLRPVINLDTACAPKHVDLVELSACLCLIDQPLPYISLVTPLATISYSSNRICFPKPSHVSLLIHFDPPRYSGSPAAVYLFSSCAWIALDELISARYVPITV